MLSTSNRTLALTAAGALALGLAGCSSDDGESANDGGAGTNATDVETADEAAESETTESEATESEATEEEDVEDSTSTESEADAEDESADDGGSGDGEGWPQAGDELFVFGVDTGDMLYVREAAGPNADTLGTLTDTRGHEVNGQTQDVDGVTWYEVDAAEKGEGWSAGTYLVYQGAEEDVTDEFDYLDGISNEEAIAGMETFVNEGDTPTADVVVVRDEAADPSDNPDATHAIGLDADVVVDVVGVQDTSVAGYRYALYYDDDQNLESVSMINMCTRGVSDEGLCS